MFHGGGGYFSVDVIQPQLQLKNINLTITTTVTAAVTVIQTDFWVGRKLKESANSLYNQRVNWRFAIITDIGRKEHDAY